MALSTADLAWVRGKVGSEPSDANLNARYDRLGTKEAVAREVWSERLADLAATPAKLDVDGEMSQDTSANISAIHKILADPDLYVPGDVAPGEVVVVRPRPRPLR